MCPKMNSMSNSMETLNRTSSIFQQWKRKFTELHRVTIFAIILYVIFVFIFVCANILTCAWHLTMDRKRRRSNVHRDRRDPLLEESSTQNNKTLPLSNVDPDDDETESETSFGDDQNGILERTGRKIDDRLHQIFTW